MIRSLYLSGTNMIVQRRKMDVTTNNIANLETNGFKADKLLSRSFSDMLLSRVGDPAVLHRRTEVGPLNTGVHIDEVVTSFASGNIVETQKTSDMAIVGDGFFTVATPAGERYTRDGSFVVNRDGFLVSADGHFVLGTNGALRVGDEHFAVDAVGNVTASDGTYLGQLRVATFDDLAGLRKTGNNLYVNYTNQTVRPAANSEVKQGFLETSNVQAAAEMVEMLTLYRHYETSQRMVKMVDETLAKAVNEVGRL